MNQEEAMSSRNYNPQSLRLEYPAAFIESMPIKEVGDAELYELRHNFDYNPSSHYSDNVVLLQNEAGHDSKYRYVRAK